MPADSLLERFGPWLVGLLQAGLVSRLVSVRDLLRSGPIRGGDFSAHYYQAAHAAERFHRSGALWGYDPFWMAGYPEGLISLIDNKLFLLVLAAVPEAARPIAFNATIVLMLLAVPALGYWAGRLAGGSRAEASFVALAGVVATFTVPVVVFFWAGGAISFFFAAVLAVPVALGLANAIGEPHGLSARWLGWVGGAMAAVAMHPAIVPAFGAALIPLVAAPTGTRARVAGRLLVLCTAMAIALWWPVVAMRYVNLTTPVSPVAWWLTSDFLQGGRARLWQDWVGHFLRTDPGWAGGAGGLTALGVLAVASLRAASLARRGAQLAAWLPAVLCFGLAYGTSGVPALRFTQPYRFLVPFAFFLCVPAGLGTAAWLHAPRRRSVLALAAGGLLLSLIGESALSAKDLVLGAGADDVEERLVELFGDRQRNEGRVLVESLWTDVPFSAGSRSHMTVKRFVLLPLRLGRECLGYTGTAPLSPQRYASFAFGRLLGLDLERATPQQLEDVLHRYAVSWVVACSAQARQRLARFDAIVEPDRELADCQLLRVLRPEASKLLEGSGVVVAGLDRIDVHDAAGERLVLKYHWIPGLHAVPPLRIEEHRIAAAPVGFVAVYPEGRRDFTIAW